MKSSLAISSFAFSLDVAAIFMSSSPSTPVMSYDDTELALKVHPDYAFANTDLILLSSDGTRFYVHSVILQLASNTFSNMLVAKRVEKDGPVELTESSATLSILLDIVYPARMPPSTILISDFRAVAIAAEKYDIAHVTKVLKEIILGKISSTTLLPDEEEGKAYIAIKAYLAASDLGFGWTSVANELSAGTLSCDLNSDVAQNMLFAEDADRSVVKGLLSFHRDRRIWIYNALQLLVREDGDMLGSADQRSSCRSYFLQNIVPSSGHLSWAHALGCRAGVVGYCGGDWNGCHIWWKFKAKVLRMLETDASGAQFLSDKFYACAELRQLLAMPCCRKNLVDNEVILINHLRLVLESLPKTIAEFRAATNLKDSLSVVPYTKKGRIRKGELVM